MKKIYSYLLLSLFVLLASFSFSQGIAEIGLGTGTTSGRVMHTYYTDGRSQFTYTAQELTAAGVLPNADITSVAWNMQSGGLGYPMNNANVRMSQQAGLPTTFVASPTTVWSGTYTILAPGWQTITFSIPFTWDGVSNLVVEYCFDNVGYDASTYFYYTSMSGYTEYNYRDNDVGCSLTDYPSSYRLNAQFGYTNPSTDYTWTGAAGDGNWNTAGNWDANAVPSSSIACIIPAGPPAEIVSGGDCANLTIDAGALLNVLPGVTINVNGNLSDVGGVGMVEGKIYVTGTVSVIRGFTIAPGGELECDGNMTLSPAGYTFINEGTIDCNGTFNATGGTITQGPAGNIEVSGSVTSFGTLNNDAGTVTYDGGTDFFNDYYYNVVLSSGNTHSIAGTPRVYGTLTVSSGSTLDISNLFMYAYGPVDLDGTLTISTGTLDSDNTFNATGGNVTFTGAGLLKLGGVVTSLGTFTKSTSTVEYDYASTSLIDQQDYYNLEIDGNCLTAVSFGTTSVENELKINTGSKLAVAGALSPASVDIDGTLAMASAVTVSGTSDIDGTLAIGATTYNADGAFDATNATIDFTGAGTLALSSTVTSIGSDLDNTLGTVKYDGTSAQNVVAPSSGGYYDLTIENASTKTATGNIDVDGALTTEAEASCILDMNTYDLNVAGNLTVGQEGGLDASDAACAVTFDGNSSLTHAGSQIVTNTLTPGQELLNDGLSNLNNWTAEQHNNSTSWSVGNGSAYFSANSGGSCAWMQESNYNYSEASIIYDLPSPQTGMSVSFYYINPSWSGDIDWLDVDYYNGSTWTNIVRYSAGAASWTSVSSLAIPDGATKVRFYGLLGYGFGVGVDDVIITGDVNVVASTSINPTFNEIVVNGGDVTLAQDVDVTTSLTLTSGDIITSSSNKLTIESTAASALTTGSASSMIVGPFDRKTNSTDDYLLPVGDGTNYRPVVITPSATTATTYTAEFKNTAHASISYDADGYTNTPCTVPNDLDHVANGCWWDIERTTSGSDCYVALNWDATCGVDTPNDIVLAHYNGSSWDKIGATLTDNTGSGSATASNGRVKSDLFVGDFSPFNLGSGSGNNSLPIDLLSFHTECSHDIVDVNFSVVSQINNEKFLIERSTDAVEWEVVGELPGVPGGNSNTQMDYVFTDNYPLANLSYYRLTQVDFDGKVKTFYPVSSSCGSTVGGLPVDVYPNPAWSDVTIEFELDQYQGDDVYYTITDATGKTVMSDYLELNKGFNKNTLDINKLPRGVYILRFNQTKDHITETRIVKR